MNILRREDPTSASVELTVSLNYFGEQRFSRPRIALLNSRFATNVSK